MPISIIVLIALLAVMILVLTIYYIRIVTRPQILSSIQKDIETKSYGTAIKRLQAIVQKNPQDYPAHKLLARAYQLSGNSKMAIVEYRVSEKNVDNEPSSYEVDIRQNLAKLLYETNDFKEALEEFILLLKVDPKNAESYHLAGRCYIKLGAYDKAIQYFRHAVKYNPQLQEVYFDLGLALYESQSLAEALNEFILSIKFNPKNYRAYYYMGAIYRQLQDFGKAIESLDIAERDKEVQVQSILNKGICHLQLGNIQRTIEELSRGIKIYTGVDNTLFLMRYHLAEAYEIKKDVSAAIEQWEKISAHSPKFKDVAAKLEQYNDIRQSDVLKDYISSPIDEFQTICASCVEALGLAVVDTMVISNDEVHVTARESSKMLGKTLLKLVIFMRISEPVGEDKIRQSLDLTKSVNAQMCIFFSNSGFTRPAREFATTRPFEIYDSKKINELLSK